MSVVKVASLRGHTESTLTGRNVLDGGDLSTCARSDGTQPALSLLIWTSEISTRDTPPRKSVRRISAGGVLLRLVDTPALDRIWTGS